jgi:hypothetical protein
VGADASRAPALGASEDTASATRRTGARRFEGQPAGGGVAGRSQRFRRSMEGHVQLERVGVVRATWPRLMLAGALGACVERAHALGWPTD